MAASLGTLQAVDAQEDDAMSDDTISVRIGHDKKAALDGDRIGNRTRLWPGSSKTR